MILSIQSIWDALSGPEKIYWGIALISTGLFIFQLIISLIGLDSDLEAELDDIDASGFSVISVRSIIAFAMFFGWGGIAALSQGYSAPKALMIAFLIGFLAMVAVAYVFTQILKLQESGTVDILDAVMKEGEVYLSIPAKGSGKGRIHLKLSDKFMEFDAVTEEDKIETGKRIKVVEVLRDNTMLVQAIG